MTNNRVHLVIATPAAGGQVYSAYMLSCVKLQGELEQMGQTVSYEHVTGALVHRMRNRLVADFLGEDRNKEATHLLFIDADTEFDPASIIKMIDLNKDVVGGICPLKEYNMNDLRQGMTKRQSDEEAIGAALNYNVDFFDKDHLEIQPDGSIEVKSIGTGVLLIKKGVFEKIKPLCSINIDKKALVGFFEASREIVNYFDFIVDEDGVECGEDISFCRKLNEAGIKIWTLPNEDVIHWGTHAYKGKFSTTLYSA